MLRKVSMKAAALYLAVVAGFASNHNWGYVAGCSTGVAVACCHRHDSCSFVASE